MITKVVTVSGLNVGMFIHIKPLKVQAVHRTIKVLMNPQPFLLGFYTYAYWTGYNIN